MFNDYGEQEFLAFVYKFIIVQLFLILTPFYENTVYTFVNSIINVNF